LQDLSSHVAGFGICVNPVIVPEGEIKPIRDAAYDGQCDQWKSQKKEPFEAFPNNS
jgi:hypothetical protein